MDKNRLILIAVGIVILAGFVFAVARSFGVNTGLQDVNQVVAVVDGSEITRGELDEQIKQLEGNPQAQVPDKNLKEERAEFERLVLDDIINRKLLSAEIDGQGFVIEEEEVDAEIETIKGRFESSEAFESQLEQFGLSEQSLREEIRQSLKNNRYFEKIAEEKNITVTDDEVAAVYDEQIAPLEGGPPLSDVAPQIKEQLEQEKLQEALLAVIQELRSSADIQILI